MRESYTATRDEEPNRSIPIVQPGMGARTGPLVDRADEREAQDASFRAVLANRQFRSLWIAQTCSQLAQKLTWFCVGGYVAKQTHKNALVSVIMVSGMLAQLFL